MTEFWTALEQVGMLLAIIIGIGTMLGTFGGGVWWASSLYAEVRGMRKDIQRIADTMEHEHQTLWERIDQHGVKLDNHEVRIVRMED